MPVRKFAKKDDIPKEVEANAIALADGTFAVFEEADTSDLTKSLNDERTKREAAEKLATKTANELKKLENDKKAAEGGITAEKLAEIRADVRKEVEAEFKPQLDELATVKGDNRKLNFDAKLKALAVEKGGVIGEKQEQWFKLHGDKFDLTADGKSLVVKGKEGADVLKHITETCKTELPDLYIGTKANGGGAGGAHGSGNTAGATTLTAEQIMANPSAAFDAANATTT